MELKRFYYIAIFFISFIGWGQKSFIHLSVDPKSVEPGQELNVIIKHNLDGELSTNVPSEFSFTGNVMEQSYSEADFSSGKFISYKIVSRTGAFKKEGNFVLGPAFIKIKNKVYRSNSVTVKVEKSPTASNQGGDEVTSRQLKQPAFGVIHRSKSKVFQGEPFILETRIFTRFYPDDLGQYSTYEVSDLVEKYELQNQKSNISEANIKGIGYYMIQADKNIVFASEIGKINISPFKATLVKGFENYNLTSSSTSITVVPLPKGKPKSFSGLIGNYELTREISKKKYKKGDIIEMTIKVSGKGNLHKLKIKDFNLSKDVDLYGDPVINNDYAFTQNGAEGSVTYKINLRILDGGNFTLPKFEISYFDPETEKYITLSEKSESIEVEGTKTTASSNPVADVVNPNETLFFDQTAANSKENSNSFDIKSLVTYVSIPTILLLTFLLFRKKKKDNNEIEKTIITNKEMDLPSNVEHIQYNNQIDFVFKKSQIQSLIQNFNYSATLNEINSLLHLYVLHSKQISERKNSSKEEIIEFFKNKNANSVQIEGIEFSLDMSENAKYGFGLNDDELQKVIDSYRNFEGLIG